MIIKILGSGCPTCKKLYERTCQAITGLGLEISVDYVTDVQKIVDMGIMQSPVLTINNQPILAGIVPEVEKIKEIIKASPK